LKLKYDDKPRSNFAFQLKLRRCIKVVTLTMSDMVRQMENAIQFGDPVLIQAGA